MVRPLLYSIAAFFRSRTESAIEILALRQQLAVFKANRPRPKLSRADRAFWIAMRRWWPSWQRALLIVQPETVGTWHRRGLSGHSGDGIHAELQMLGIEISESTVSKYLPRTKPDPDAIRRW